MKKALLLITVLLVPLMLSAQHMITRSNGDEIRCKILSVDSTHIYFSMNLKGTRTRTLLSLDQVAGYNFDPPKEREDRSVFMFEVDFTPFNPEAVIRMNQVQTKVWLGDKAVWRLGFKADKQNGSITEDDHDRDEVNPYTYEMKSFLRGVSTGLEYRMLGASAFSPYLGVDIGYSRQTASFKNTYWVRTGINAEGEPNYEERETSISGGWPNYESADLDYQRLDFTTLEATLLFGADFIIYKNLYMGFEAGLGITKHTTGQLIVESDEMEEKLTYPGSTNISKGLRYNNAIRLGVFF